jgi:hypothetical protein
MLKVQVSPFLGVSEWVEPHSGITFSKSGGVIDIPDEQILLESRNT